MPLEGLVEHVEQVVDFANKDPLDDEHGEEEDKDLPQAHERVREIASRLHVLLHLSQVSHHNCNKYLVNNFSSIFQLFYYQVILNYKKRLKKLKKL